MGRSPPNVGCHFPPAPRATRLACLASDKYRSVAGIRHSTNNPATRIHHMDKHQPVRRAFIFCATLCFVFMACVPTLLSAEDQIEILKIKVGDPTKLSDSVYQNTANLMVSRAGVVAAFYPKPRTGPHFYRLSTDRGITWSGEMSGPPELGGGIDTTL